MFPEKPEEEGWLGAVGRLGHCCFIAQWGQGGKPDLSCRRVPQGWLHPSGPQPFVPVCHAHWPWADLVVALEQTSEGIALC